MHKSLDRFTHPSPFDNPVGALRGEPGQKDSYTQLGLEPATFRLRFNPLATEPSWLHQFFGLTDRIFIFKEVPSNIITYIYIES